MKAMDDYDGEIGNRVQHNHLCFRFLYLIDKASGNSVDWAHGKLRIPYAYAVELPDMGHYGFLMPPRYIIPTGEETVEAIKVIGRGVMAYGAASKIISSLTTA